MPRISRNSSSIFGADDQYEFGLATAPVLRKNSRRNYTKIQFIRNELEGKFVTLLYMPISKMGADMIHMIYTTPKSRVTQQNCTGSNLDYTLQNQV